MKRRLHPRWTKDNSDATADRRVAQWNFLCVLIALLTLWATYSRFFAD